MNGSINSNPTKPLTSGENRMPLVTLVSPYETYRGRDAVLGGGVVYPIGGRNFRRAFVVPTNPNTPQQQAARNAATLASQGFSLLTDAQRATWDALADEIFRTDPNGQSYRPGSKGVYVGVNSVRILDGQAQVTTAPAFANQAAPSDITSVTDVTGDIEVEFEHSNADGFFMFQFTRPLPGLQRQPRAGDYFMPTITAADSIIARAASPQLQSFTAASLRFAWANGDRIGVRITSFSAGYIKGQSISRTMTIAV